MLRVTKDRKRKYVSLGISVNPENWDFSKNQPKAECPNREYIELLIADKLKEYSAKIVELKATNQEFTSTTLVEKVCVNRVEKARAFDPFGHAGLPPLGEIRMTLAGEIKMTPVEASAGEFFVALRLLVLARRGSISKTTEYDCKIKKHPSMLRSRNGNKRDGQYVSSFPQHSTQV